MFVVTPVGREDVVAYYARTMAISDRIGCRGLLVHCESDSARSFSRHLVPEFEPSPTDDLHLVLLLKDIRRTLRETAS